MKEELRRKGSKKRGMLTIKSLITPIYRANAIQSEVITSHKKNVEIELTWQELEEEEDCEELAKVNPYH